MKEKKMDTTVCGIPIDEHGFLMQPEVGEMKMKKIEYQYEGKILYFCEQSCIQEFNEASDKKAWIEGHRELKDHI